MEPQNKAKRKYTVLEVIEKICKSDHENVSEESSDYEEEILFPVDDFSETLEAG